MTRSEPPTAALSRRSVPPPGLVGPASRRWAPLGFTLLCAGLLLVRAGTSPVDLLQYAAYVVFALLLPGTLVYRALRPRRRTLVEDLAMGAAVGLVLELAAWVGYSMLDWQGWAWTWPALVAVPFLAVPALRRHWRPDGYQPVPVAWSWSVAGVVCCFTAYLAVVFLDRNPILPPNEGTQQYLDLAYQLSLAGQAKHSFPVTLPQVAGEPLYYHWFGYVHMAMTSLIGHLDLPVVALRLSIPALCALAIVLTAVVGWRLTGRPLVGAVAAVLFFAVGEFNFTDPVTMPFGTQVTFVIWHGMSMIYSWVLLIAVILPLAEIIRRDSGTVTDRPEPADRRERVGLAGAFVVATVLLFGSSGAKASTLPVVAVALAVTAVAMLVGQRRIPWAVVGAGVITGAAQLFATAVLYRFQTYGTGFGPLQGLSPYWSGSGEPGVPQWLLVLGVWLAFGLNMLLRTVGAGALVWLRRGRLSPVQWFLLGGAVAGPGIYLTMSQASGGNQYFTRAGFTFGALLSAWGWVMVFDRAQLFARGRRTLAVATGAFALVLVWAQVNFARPQPPGGPFQALAPMLTWALVLGLAAVAGAVVWRVLRRYQPAMRGRGGLVLLTLALVAGAPGLIMDGVKSVRSPNGGAYANVPLPGSRVDAARWVRDHSAATDVVATNVHCLAHYGELCDSRSFWLSAYAERSVLVEGWAFAPRMAATGLGPFWDPDRLALNDAAFQAPTPEILHQLRDGYGVRWLVVDRAVRRESEQLTMLAPRRYDNGRLAVYELGSP
ncbi:MAG TPA: hypothetical protein VF163_07705 [Micromonosporaceae bacterium]